MPITDVLFPQNPPKPTKVDFVRNEMRMHGADDWMTPEQRREKRMAEAREKAKQHYLKYRKK